MHGSLESVIGAITDFVLGQLARVAKLASDYA